MSGHTPGIILQPLVPHGYEFVANGKVLAEVFDPGLARLFAASDEMLELLKLFVEAHVINSRQQMCMAVDEAQALIEKVEVDHERMSNFI